MAFMSMFLVMIFFAITICGLFLLLIGIILDVIWGVKKKKKKKVNIVLKIFAIFLTVVGLLVAVGPISIVGLMSLSSKIADQKEINQFDDTAQVYLDNVQDIYDKGFDFEGVHYVRCDDIHPQTSHDNYVKEECGVIVDGNKHRIIYRVHNTLGINIFDVEYSSGLFVAESDIPKLIDYYENEAPLYVEITEYGTDHSKRAITDIDSERVREIRDRISTEGSNRSYSNPDIQNADGYMIFYATDDLSCFDITYIMKSDGIMLGIGMYYIRLTSDDPDAAYIISLIEQ